MSISMLYPKRVKKLLYRLSWAILSCLISSSLSAYYYRISYTNTSGERINFHIKTNTFLGEQEIPLNTSWLQQHSTFSSFGSLTVVNVPRYQVERIDVIDTLGHPVFNIQGGPVISAADLESSTGDMGGVSQLERNDAYMINPSDQLSRAVLPVFQAIEGELSRPNIQGISSVNYENRGDQFDLYLHFISPDSYHDASTVDNIHSLLDSLVREGVISAWRHRSESIREPAGNMFTVVLSGLFADTGEASQQTAQANSSQNNSPSNTGNRERFRVLLTRLLGTNWNGFNSLALQLGYSGAGYIALNNSPHERIIYDAGRVYGVALQFLNHFLETISEDVEENWSAGIRWPPNEYSGPLGPLSSGYFELIRRLRSSNLATVHRNFNQNDQSWHSIQHYQISSVFVSPHSGQSYKKVVAQPLSTVVSDIGIIARKINQPDLHLLFKFINIEDEGGIVRVNFMLESYITDDSQRERTEQMLRSIDASTSYQTTAMRWQPISISVQHHNSVLSVASAPLSQYFSPDTELESAASPANATTPEAIPLDEFRNNSQVTDEENFHGIPIRGLWFKSK